MASACADELDVLPTAARAERIRALADVPENRRAQAVERSLEVRLSNGK